MINAGSIRQAAMQTRRQALGLLAAGGGLVGLPSAGRTETPVKSVKIGILTDMSGPFSDKTGPGSVNAANMAAEDFAAEAGDLKVQIIAGACINRIIARVAIDRISAGRSGQRIVGTGSVNHSHRYTLSCG